MTPTPSGTPAPHWSRRDFLRSASTLTAALSFSPAQIIAGPFEPGDWNRYIPADKKLSPTWIESLRNRGTPTTYRKSKNELRHIGMPVGGLCCGTLYLGGDGKLWNWDLFNQKTLGVLPRRARWADVGMNFETGDTMIRPQDGATYAIPPVQADSQAITQGFAIRVTTNHNTQTRPLDTTGWSEITFTGQYPVATVRYTDPECPVDVQLEAYSPFIPLNVEESSLPATVFRFTLTNHSNANVTAQLAGWMQNASLFHSAKPADGTRINTAHPSAQANLIAMAFQPRKAAGSSQRPDILVQDFEHGYGNWTVEGTAFGTTPIDQSAVPSYQGALGGEGTHAANSHSSAPGKDTAEKDNATGKLTSPPLKLQRKFLSFYIGGGQRPDVQLRLLVNGQVVRTATGHNANRMRLDNFDVTEWEGSDATLELVDNARGAWGNIGLDHVTQTDNPRLQTPVEQRNDFGTFALAQIKPGRKARLHPSIPPTHLPDAAFEDHTFPPGTENAPVGAVQDQWTLAPGQSTVAHFVLAWHFPNTTLPVPDAKSGNHYAKRFHDATAVAKHIASHLTRLESATLLWRDTWADSTLPHWFLERTFATASTLATTTAHRFATGRFWGWEGIGCCEGTCTHVWHYAQAVARLFPELERDLRERVDFGVGFDNRTGMIRHRAEGTGPAIDGHCGRIIGAWREHQMSSNDGFLKRLWPRIKQATEYVLQHDHDGDGILDGSQENTLDAAWYGQISWITSLSLTALRAAEEMAVEIGDREFAARCRTRFETAKTSVESKLFNGEYFIQIADPTRPKSLGTYEACHIDQVHGQSWAWQVHLGRVLDRDKTLSALRALWKYNFAPDVGPFRKKFTAGRPYALAGDAGLVMTSNPKLVPNVYGTPSWQIGYFNECMSGFEHQAASHMMAEGMTLEALAITRAIHDRYHAARRNPFNEIECSDHYARAMASYGTFIAACGFECHGPRGHLGFAPRLTPENFRAPFTVPEGWGTYQQQRDSRTQTHKIEIRYGSLRLQSLAVELPSTNAPLSILAQLGNQPLPVASRQLGQRLEILPNTPAHLHPGQSLRVTLQG